MVKDVIENEGAYILFHNWTLNEKQRKDRRVQFKQGIKESSYECDSESIKIYIYDAGKIAAWANESITAVVAVWKWVGHLLPYGAKTWKDWSGYQDNTYHYVLDEEIKL